MPEETATRAELLAVIRALRAALAERDAQVADLEARIRELEAQLAAAGRRAVPGVKPSEAPERAPRPRKPRARGYARRRSRPTHRIVHAWATCPKCHCALMGGWVHRRREVLEVVPTPVRVEEHLYLARHCPVCEQRYVPPANLGRRVLGRGRLGLGLLSLIATLREEGRLPFPTIQWYLATVHDLHLSGGAIVAACHRVARHGQPAVDLLRAEIRASPQVNADETGWREAGRNGYVWTFSTPTVRYFVRRNRGKAVVDEVLGPEFTGVLNCDFYAAYHHYDGLKQRCWAHLLREIHDLRVAHPADTAVQAWARRVGAIYRRAVASAPA
jgi:transposase